MARVPSRSKLAPPIPCSDSSIPTRPTNKTKGPALGGGAADAVSIHSQQSNCGGGVCPSSVTDVRPHSSSRLTSQSKAEAYLEYPPGDRAVVLGDDGGVKALRFEFPSRLFAVDKERNIALNAS